MMRKELIIDKMFKNKKTNQFSFPIPKKKLSKLFEKYEDITLIKKINRNDLK